MCRRCGSRCLQTDDGCGIRSAPRRAAEGEKRGRRCGFPMRGQCPTPVNAVRNSERAMGAHSCVTGSGRAESGSRVRRARPFSTRVTIETDRNGVVWRTRVRRSAVVRGRGASAQVPTDGDAGRSWSIVSDEGGLETTGCGEVDVDVDVEVVVRDGLADGECAEQVIAGDVSVAVLRLRAGRRRSSWPLTLDKVLRLHTKSHFYPVRTCFRFERICR